MNPNPMEVALSTDLVMDAVLIHIKVKDLLNCRLVSKLWNKVASSILRKRWTMMRTISDEEDLAELEQRMRQSLDFPFSGLNCNQPWLLNSGGATEFFQNYGSSFTCLRLVTRWVLRLQDLAPFIVHLSRLSVLEMGRSNGCPPPVELSVSGAGQDDGKILKLPSVTIIRILKPCPEVNGDVLREVFTAASPSLRIECLDATPEILRVLNSAGRLRALSSIKFDKDYENKKFGLELDHMLSTEPPTLTRLVFDEGACLSRDGLQTLLLSSQNTLKEVQLDGMCLFEKSWDEFPIFTKLTKLSVSNRKGYCHGHVCRGTHGQKFPALKELKLDMSYERFKTLRNSISDGFFVVLSVTKIVFPRYFDENGMKMLAQWFPNVTEVCLQYPSDSGCYMAGNDPCEIWNVREFKRLEKLRICNWPAKKCIDMDCFLTGIPSNVCLNLRRNNQLDRKNNSYNDVLRVKPNILQVKNLKELAVCVESGFALPTEHTPFMSMISVRYALGMMPNLQTKFIYGHHSPPHSRTPNETTMEAAFKHVLPYVQLEFSPY